MTSQTSPNRGKLVTVRASRSTGAGLGASHPTPESTRETPAATLKPIPPARRVTPGQRPGKDDPPLRLNRWTPASCQARTDVPHGEADPPGAVRIALAAIQTLTSRDRKFSGDEI